MALRKTNGSGITVATTHTNTAETANAIDRQLNELRQRIARRAYDMCAERGWMHGQDLEDWLRAESEITASSPIVLTENGDQYTIRADVPGFRDKDLEIFCEPNRVLIRGNATNHQEKTKGGQVLYTEHESSEVFRLVNLPQEINPDAAQATLRDGVLELTLPKSEESKPTRVQVRAA